MSSQNSSTSRYAVAVTAAEMQRAGTGDGDLRHHFGQRLHEADRYIAVTNRVLDGLPTDLHISMHLCRGNRGGQWHSEGSYDAVADKLFNDLHISAYFLEYDTPRAGDFSPLRFVPQEKTIVLGLVSTKTDALEEKDALRRRIEAASRYVPHEHLALSPQCGFASIETGNPIWPAMQEEKLRLIVETAEQQWGTV